MSMVGTFKNLRRGGVIIRNLKSKGEKHYIVLCKDTVSPDNDVCTSFRPPMISINHSETTQIFKCRGYLAC